jgi:hypothetical protein
MALKSDQMGAQSPPFFILYNCIILSQGKCLGLYHHAARVPFPCDLIVRHRAPLRPS